MLRFVFVYDARFADTLITYLESEPSKIKPAFDVPLLENKIVPQKILSFHLIG